MKTLLISLVAVIAFVSTGLTLSKQARSSTKIGGCNFVELLTPQEVMFNKAATDKISADLPIVTEGYATS